MPANTRDTLYQSLPPNIKLTLRSKLPTFHVAEEVRSHLLVLSFYKC